MITLEQIQNHPQTKVFMNMADTNLAAMGYTEHGIRHAKLVARMTSYLLDKLGYDLKTQVLGSIAGYLHDIGNAINRNDHGISSAFLAYQILRDLKADPEDIARIISAAGNHDEERGEPVNNIAAAVVIADKADVHSSRVRSTKEITFDIHDRVNYAVKKSRLQVNPKIKTITLELSIDNSISKVMEYFEIFLTRMMACQKAAKHLGYEFKLVINKTKIL
jgi:hypothetical protein